ncbi:MAG TPA: hypothetical protein VLG37_02270 [Candidatus Saccharimonadales bacterium]|nr:hypothetical protein [Candidatus Saccharimonadales bacterium]
MKRELLGLGLAATVALTGCEGGNQESKTPLPRVTGGIVVKNILNVPLLLSDNPDTYNSKTKKGKIEAGGTAFAGCIVYRKDYPKNSQLLVSHGKDTGYVGVYTAGSKTTEPKPQIEPGLDALRTQLPDCDANGSAKPTPEITPKVASQKCQADKPEAWTGVPSNLNEERVAQNLNVDVSRVRAGRFGAAICNIGIKVKDMNSTVIGVEGIGSPCVIVGVSGGDRPPQSGEEILRNVLAVCVVPPPTV